MQKRTFWRIEGPDGKGPWNGSFHDRNYSCAVKQMRDHPKFSHKYDPGGHPVGWWEDEINPYLPKNWEGMWWHGFSSLKQMKMWFIKWQREFLHNLGYKMVQYEIEVKHYLRSQSQVMIRLRYATKLQTRSLLSI